MEKDVELATSTSLTPSPTMSPQASGQKSTAPPPVEATSKSQVPNTKSKSTIIAESIKISICSCLKTLLGPQAPSFLWCCCCCRHDRKLLCSLSSTATKTMNLILLIMVVILSCLFIIPPNVSHLKDTSSVDFVAPAYFFPCGDEAKTGSKENFIFFNVNGFWEDCRGHGGYFFVYRFFFCLIIFYMIMSLLTFNITSTKSSRRANLHRGFWFYKLAIVGALMLIACLAIRVYQGGGFEYFMMWIGLLGTYFFAFIEVVCALDAVELVLIKVKNSWSPKRFKILYWTFTWITYTIAVASIVAIAWFNLSRDYSETLDKTGVVDSKDRTFFNGIDEDDFGKDENGESSFCAVHIGLIIYDIFVGVFVTMIMLLGKKRCDGRRFPNLGFLQAGLIFLYIVFQTWSAISNSTDIECRYVFFPYNPYEKNKDVTFMPQGLLNGLIAGFTILYYVYANGAKTKAPWTVVFNKLWYLTSGYPKISGDEPPEPLTAWHDEKTNVTYSWPLFYITLILGSLSLMMAMTNYANPHAESGAAGNEAALVMKMLTTASCVLFFMAPLVKTCSSIYPDEEFPLPPTPTQSHTAATATQPGEPSTDELKKVIQVLLTQQRLSQPAAPAPAPLEPISSSSGANVQPMPIESDRAGMLNGFDSKVEPTF